MGRRPANPRFVAVEMFDVILAELPAVVIAISRIEIRHPQAFDFNPEISDRLDPVANLVIHESFEALGIARLLQVLKLLAHLLNGIVVMLRHFLDLRQQVAGFLQRIHRHHGSFAWWRRRKKAGPGVKCRRPETCG